MTDSDTPFDCGRYAAELAREVNTALAELFGVEHPATLYEPARYVLAAGGKRFRPVMFLLAARSLGIGNRAAMPVALAIEVFHNFTLVHDDIMDRADERRGRPTVHKRWDESVAILSGDLMLARSYALLAELSPGQAAPVLASFNRMVVALCEGQALDKEFETRVDVSVAEYLDMIGKKTGALLAFALEAGGILAGADEDIVVSLHRAGMDAGIGFQIQDDLLDLTSKSEKWGKMVGGDLVQGKKTYILLRAIERGETEDAERLRRLFERGGIEREEIDETVQTIKRTGALNDAEGLVDRCYDAARQNLAALPDNRARQTLQWMFTQLRSRAY